MIAVFYYEMYMYFSNVVILHLRLGWWLVLALYMKIIRKMCFLFQNHKWVGRLGPILDPSVWVGIGSPSAFWPELRQRIAYSGGCHYIFVIFYFHRIKICHSFCYCHSVLWCYIYKFVKMSSRYMHIIGIVKTYFLHPDIKSEMA